MIPRFFALAYHALSPEQQKELRGIIVTLAMALITASGLATYFVVVPAISQTTGQAPPGTDTTTVVRPFSPGSGFDVGDYCLHRASHVSIRQVPGAEVLGVMRIASFSDLDYIEWNDYQNNTAATRYYVDSKGQPQHDAVQVLTADALACMRTVR